MGIDIVKKHVRKGGRTAPVSENIYLRLLAKLYAFLSRRTGARFNRVVAKRLCMSRTSRMPVSTSKLAVAMRGKGEEKVAVVVAKITNDTRYTQPMPKVTVCALAFTDTARARIEAAGGKCMTFDQLAIARPTGQNCVLLRGKRKARTAYKYFGKAPGTSNSTTRPRLLSVGRKFETARGRRASRGYKNK